LQNNRKRRNKAQGRARWEEEDCKGGGDEGVLEENGKVQEKREKMER
jgi:hypothetical protein